MAVMILLALTCASISVSLGMLLQPGPAFSCPLVHLAQAAHSSLLIRPALPPELRPRRRKDLVGQSTLPLPDLGGGALLSRGWRWSENHLKSRRKARIDQRMRRTLRQARLSAWVTISIVEDVMKVRDCLRRPFFPDDTTYADHTFNRRDTGSNDLADNPATRIRDDATPGLVPAPIPNSDQIPIRGVIPERPIERLLSDLRLPRDASGNSHESR